MLFYRIEDTEGRGPYDSATGINGATSYSPERHPGPTSDGLTYDDYRSDETVRFGFVSIEQALEWFLDDMLDILIAEKWRGSVWCLCTTFALSAYEVDENKVKRGGRQAVAPVATLEPVERITLTDLKNMRKGGPKWTTNDRPSTTSPSISNERGSSAPRQRSEKLFILPLDSTGKWPTLERLSRGVPTGAISGLSFSESFESLTTDLTDSLTTGESPSASATSTTETRTHSAIDSPPTFPASATSTRPRSSSTETEEDNMTYVKDINIGDRVRATQGDEEATFTVGDKSDYSTWLAAKTSGTTFYGSEGWEFEVIEKFTPLPTEPGIYIPRPDATDDRAWTRFALTTDGGWYDLDLTSATFIPVEESYVKQFADTITPYGKKED